jgi:hypothetical protein
MIMKYSKYVIVVFIIVIVAVLATVLWFFTNFNIEFSNPNVNEKPNVTILFPEDNMSVFGLVTISGNASDPTNHLVDVEIKINDGPWWNATGTYTWSYSWNTYGVSDGLYDIQVRAWDGKHYSEAEIITVDVSNPQAVLSSEHKWALFIAADNFPKDNESKLGNGGLYLAENISSYLIEECGYPTSNVIILFDDGWIRSDNGYGTPMETLQERPHKYRISYGGATINNVVAAIDYIISESSKFQDSEVFLWIFGHGYGNDNLFAGGKILQRSAVFLWDDILTDKDLGNLLSNLASKKTCVIIDACYSGGFADKTIFNLPQLSLLNSGIPKPGRVVITGESKFTPGYAITTSGPVFSQIWFYGLITDYADGFRPGILHTGRPPIFGFFKNGESSVEEAYYYTRFMLKSQMDLREFRNMQPEINDQYPNRGRVRSMGGLIL